MFLFEIFMIFIGMIISTIFQDSINKIYASIRKILFKIFYKKRKVPFQKHKLLSLAIEQQMLL